MLGHLDRLTDQEVRRRLGRRFEAFTDEVFHVLRWVLMVGLVRFLAERLDSVVFHFIYWALAGLLFAYLASRFLLHPEIQIMPDTSKRWQRLVQSAINFVLCVLVFLLVLWGVQMLSSAVADYRGGV